MIDETEEDDETQRSSQNNRISKKKGMGLKGDKAKRALIGAGGRILFYPTLLYNLVRVKLQSQFRWWDQIDEFLLMGAVPFRKDVPRLKRLGVGGVVTLNEPHETLVPSSLYNTYEMEHLVIPTRDYLFAPSIADITRAVNFIHENALLGKTTYVHCKAGRGRSTTVVLCYLIEHKSMTVAAAFEHVRSIRPRVLLHPSQRKVVEEFKRLQSPLSESAFITTSDATYPNPLQDNPAYSVVKQYFVDADDSVPEKIVVHNDGPRGIHFRRAGPRQKVHFESDEVHACIVTCGGLCPGLNTVIREIVSSLSYMYGVKRILGIDGGYRGFYAKNTIPLNSKVVNDIHKRGGTILGNSRGGHDTTKIVDSIQDRGINQVYIIGGDGTQRGASVIFEEIRRRGLKVAVVGIPKTIDNDIPVIDKSFGFDTAVEKAQRDQRSTC